MPSPLRGATLWRDDQPPVPLPDAHAPADGDVVWLDVDPAAAVADVLTAAQPHCPGLDAEQVAALLAPSEDRDPESYANGDIRLARAFAALARDTPEIVGELLFEPVHILAGQAWVLTCWQADHDIVPAGHCATAVGRRWVGGLGKTAADLGVLILHELVLTFSPAYRGIESWLEEWELELYRDDRLDRESLPKLWTAMAELRDWIKPLNLPGVRSDVDKAWFRGATDHAEIDSVDTRINRSLHDLSELGRVLRASFALLHQKAEETDRAKRELRQQRIEMLGALFLVPTFVVGFYGANTRLPGGGTWAGFTAMLVAMVVLTGVALWLINRSHNRTRGE
jgi:Mg2+ and Co2+ transporter CorA